MKKVDKLLSFKSFNAEIKNVSDGNTESKYNTVSNFSNIVPSNNDFSKIVIKPSLKLILPSKFESEDNNMTASSPSCLQPIDAATPAAAAAALPNSGDLNHNPWAWFSKADLWQLARPSSPAGESVASEVSVSSTASSTASSISGKGQGRSCWRKPSRKRRRSSSHSSRSSLSLDTGELEQMVQSLEIGEFYGLLF